MDEKFKNSIRKEIKNNKGIPEAGIFNFGSIIYE